ncbi:MAG: putative endonuclease [Patescibacteria group bacterium]|nr:putative endonuclease [Patescibacteria group bacterium]MDQ5971040.1 putative endonuclease [Patescibacteria group bacterium]
MYNGGEEKFKIKIVLRKAIFMEQYFVYILATYKNGTLYTGVTNDLSSRIWQHKNNLLPSFTSRYGIHRLVYYEIFEDIYEAISREKQIKNLLRKKKIELIEKENPEWEDIYDKL